MKFVLLLLILSPTRANAYTPIPIGSSTDTAKANANFMDLAQEVQRRDLHGGGNIRGRLDLSTTSAYGALVTSGPVTTRSSFTADGGLYGFYRGTTTYISFTGKGTDCCACVTGSTVTAFVSDSGTISFIVNGAFKDTTNNSTFGWSLLVDGKNPAGNGLACGGTIGASGQALLGGYLLPVATSSDQLVATIRILTVAPGAHNYCLTACSNVGSLDTGTIARTVYIISEAH